MLRSTSLGFSLFIVLTACGEHGNGVFASETRTVAAFDSLTNSSAANLYVDVSSAVDPDAPVRLRVSGDENLLDEISVRVVDGHLTIDSHGTFWSEHELKVTATVASLVEVESSGSGDSEITGLREPSIGLFVSGSGDVRVVADVEEILARASGSGDLELRGWASSVDFGVSGSGDIEAFALTSNQGDARTSGSGDVEVCVTGRLDASVTGSGDVVYDCDPDTVLRADSGSGRIRSR